MQVNNGVLLKEEMDASDQEGLVGYVDFWPDRLELGQSSESAKQLCADNCRSARQSVFYVKYSGQVLRFLVLGSPC